MKNWTQIAEEAVLLGRNLSAEVVIPRVATALQKEHDECQAKLEEAIKGRDIMARVMHGACDREIQRTEEVIKLRVEVERINRDRENMQLACDKLWRQLSDRDQEIANLKAPLLPTEISRYQLRLERDSLCSQLQEAESARDGFRNGQLQAQEIANAAIDDKLGFVRECKDLRSQLQSQATQLAGMREALERVRGIYPVSKSKHITEGLPLNGILHWEHQVIAHEALSTPASEYEQRVKGLEKVYKAAQVFRLLLQPSGPDGRWIIEGHRSFGDTAAFELRTACDGLAALEGNG